MTAPKFLYPELAEAAFKSSEARSEEIIRAADAGEPPVAVLIPDLRDLIHEGCYWRLAEREIARLLVTSFQKAGKRRVGLVGLPSGACYRRYPQ